MKLRHYILACCSLVLSSNALLAADASNDWKAILSVNNANSQKSTHNMVLYISPGRPCCQKVIDYFLAFEHAVSTKSIHDPEVRKELALLVGQVKVPYLIIDGKAVHGTEAIIAWVQSHL